MHADDIRERFRASLERERAKYAEEDRRRLLQQQCDPVLRELGSFGTLINSLSRGAVGLSEVARFIAAERLRDQADAIERGVINGFGD